MGRTTSRKHAFMLIYQSQFHEESEMSFLRESYLEQLEQDLSESEPKEYLSNSDKRFIQGEFEGTLENLEEIDQIISENLVKWTIDRISKVDLSILRLSIYEMKFVEDIPISVTINEAINLAHEFSGDESPSFVNGILAKVSNL